MSLTRPPNPFNWLFWLGCSLPCAGGINGLVLQTHPASVGGSQLAVSRYQHEHLLADGKAELAIHPTRCKADYLTGLLVVCLPYTKRRFYLFAVLMKEQGIDLVC